MSSFQVCIWSVCRLDAMVMYRNKMFLTVLIQSLMLLFLKQYAHGIVATNYPQSSTHLVGSRVEFICEVYEDETENNILDWYLEWPDDSQKIRRIPASINDTISVVDHPEFEGRGQYTTIYSLTIRSDGKKVHLCTLVIRDATLKDNGWYGCTHKINPTDLHRTLLALKARLYMVQQINQNPTCEEQYADNGLRNITCSAPGGIPPAYVAWYEGDEKNADSDTGTVTLQVSDDMQELVFVCEASQGTWPPQTCSITLGSDFDTSSVAMTTGHSATKLVGSVTNDNIILIIGVIAGVILFLLLFMVVLALLVYRVRRLKRQSDNRTETTTLPELPTLDSSQQPVEQNPYGNFATSGPSSGVPPVHEEDDDYPQKPWRDNPELLSSFENDGFSDDDESFTDSVNHVNARAENPTDDQLYENI